MHVLFRPWILAAALAFVLCSSLPAALEWQQKEIALQPEVPTETIDVAYTFTNRGDAPVKVWVAGSSCGCVTPALEKDVYAPGESGTIRAVYKPGNQSGHQQKMIRVATDEHGAPLTVLTLTVDLPETYRVAPRMLRWKVGEELQAKPTVLTLPPGTGWAEPELQVPEGFEARLEAVESGRRYSVHVTPLSTSQRERVYLVLRLRGEGIEPVTLPVMLMVQ